MAPTTAEYRGESMTPNMSNVASTKHADFMDGVELPNAKRGRANKAG